MTEYVVTCTNTYRVTAATEDEARTIAWHTDAHQPTAGIAKLIDSDIEVEEDDR